MSSNHLKRREIIEDLKQLITSAEEVLDLKEELESRIVERGKGSGLRPNSVESVRSLLEKKKRSHKQLWNDINKKYGPLLMEIMPTRSQVQSEPVPEPELVSASKPLPKKSTRSGCCGSRPRIKKKPTKRRKKKKQTRRYKKMR
jgi:coenzyme F420-reducing hydrogenase alpha subunit